MRQLSICSHCSTAAALPERPPRRTRARARSIKEPGLYDYIIFNEDVEEAFRQLASVAGRALRGQARARLSDFFFFFFWRKGCGS